MDSHHLAPGRFAIWIAASGDLWLHRPVRMCWGGGGVEWMRVCVRVEIRSPAW